MDQRRCLDAACSNSAKRRRNSHAHAKLAAGDEPGLRDGAPERRHEISSLGIGVSLPAQANEGDDPLPIDSSRTPSSHLGLSAFGNRNVRRV
jgi:hypothetical protein